MNGGKLLVTGAAGFIGSHVAAEALARGYEVTGLDREPCRVEGIEFIRADIRDAFCLRRVVAGKDYVIHLAAVTSNVEFAKSPGDCYETNANSFLNLIDAAAKAGCARFVYASSAAVYRDGFSESAAIKLGEQDNHYAKSKIMNEMVATSYADICAIKTIGLRYFNVYGDGENAKGDYASIVTLFLKARMMGEELVIYGDGSQARDLINIADATRVTLDLLEKGSERVYNVGTGVATTYAAIATMIDERPPRHIPNPLASYQYYTRAETAKLREVLGNYEFIDLEKGVKQMNLLGSGQAPGRGRPDR